MQKNDVKRGGSGAMSNNEIRFNSGNKSDGIQESATNEHKSRKRGPEMRINFDNDFEGAVN